ncbi:hypothetical protein KIN20_024888 [Parelaphostrongylus tenuis]|uniref:Uncharacterized protein n=1 Tax=Parelaphostrongylus tenuis TaxID=148309 RepID=A0AAD5QWA3_PARTN|nr:hypothetical protein KIN20_024888 [Parelaphostrongylus tenuis]
MITPMFIDFNSKVLIEQHDLCVLVRRCWGKGSSILKTVDEFNEGKGGDTTTKLTKSSVFDECDLQAALDAETTPSTRDLREELGVSQRVVVKLPVAWHRFDLPN